MNKNADRRGIALVLVLSFLVLITALIVAFFSSIMTELSASKSYADGVVTKQLSDSVTSLVIGTIKDATLTSGGTWASQPGMIRTYGGDGDPLAYYKLYSSGTIKLTDNLKTYNSGSDLDQQWDQKQALYTDLNSPAYKTTAADPSNPKPVFPIIDPRARTTAAGTSIEGFDYGAIAGADVVPNGMITPGDSPDKQRLPMPVRWLYVLQDGAITAPTDISNGAATWNDSTGPIPSLSNPIIGRIAYWTDDETSKLNINTAAGDVADPGESVPGSYWDVPVVNSVFDVKLGIAQPFQNEFQRYPGHPATVSLSAVFPTLTRDNILQIAPRIYGAGSTGGTVQTFDTTLPSLKVDSDRLYASIDELMFEQSLDGSLRKVNPAIDHDSLEKAKFFLTVNSRAPDLNLFGQPRISVWPLSNATTSADRTPTDQLIAFCTTVGSIENGKRYHFTRSDPNSPTFDYQQLKDPQGRPRNQQLYAYLQSLTGKQIPGFGGPTNGFADKYKYRENGALERDQILTEIYDYIRAVNLHDGLLTATGGNPYTPPHTAKKWNYAKGSGQVVPIQIGNTGGFGRMDSISEAAIFLYASDLSTSGTTTRVSKVRACLAFERFNVAAGFADITPNYTCRIATLPTNPATVVDASGTNSNTLRISVVAAGGTTTYLPSFRGQSNHVVSMGGVFSTPVGGVECITGDFITDDDNVSIKEASCDPLTGGFKSVSLDLDHIYPYVTTAIPVSAEATNLKIEDTNLTLEILAPDGVTTLKKINLFFPATTVNIPAVPTDPQLLDFDYRISGLRSGSPNWTLLGQSAIIRSIEFGGKSKGDLRLIFNKSFTGDSVPNTYFGPHESYYKWWVERSHSIATNMHDSNFPNATVGEIIPGCGYQWAHPALPPSSIKKPLEDTPGDWDNGIGYGVDGPYINKTDDGNSNADTNNVPQGPYFMTCSTQFDNKSLCSPNRMIASAVQFGSLPTGVVEQKPWQTLLFRPDPTGTHPGSAAPKDHLLLDLFTMPTVEPYAISEPLSTAGRINMNYRIAPFGYIRRDTALRAALKSTMVMSIPTADGNVYKYVDVTNNVYRHRVDPDENSGTLKFFEDRFNLSDANDSSKHGIFVSASEICDVPLVPKGTTAAQMQDGSYWNDKLLTGDNTREKPYSHLYPLLTTKSNTYTVHFKVQALKKSKKTQADQWVEGKDQIIGEHRGSSTIERYIDPQDPLLDPGNTAYLDPDSNSLEPLYRYRVVNITKFAP